MIILVLALFILFQNSVFGYIDPGTGSLLFSALFGIIGTLFFLFKALLIKLKTISFSKNKSIVTEASKKARIIIYGEDKRYYNVFKPIIEELIKLEIPVIYYSSSEDDPIFEMNSDLLHREFIGVGNKAYAKLNLIEADICLMTTPNLDVFQLKRSKGVKKYVHIMHSVGSAVFYCIYGLDFFDAVLLDSELEISEIRELENIRNTNKKDLYVIGSTYLDELNKKKEYTLTKINNNNNKVVLIAPSWGINGLLTRFGEKIIDPIVSNGYYVIIRPHPQSSIVEKDMLERLKNKYSHNVEWDFNIDNIYSLSRADVMISDFSGVIFDYAFLFEKPVIIPTFTFDIRGYDAKYISGELWSLNTIKKISLSIDENNFSDISNIINNALNNASLKDNIKKAKDEAYKYQGNAARNGALILSKMLTELN